MNETRSTILSSGVIVRSLICLALMLGFGFAMNSQASDNTSSLSFGSSIVAQDALINDRLNKPVTFDNHWVQSDANRASGQLRSRSEVVREIKRQYNAEVLKIKLNQQGSAYTVRILMPNGRVRQITVSARR